MPTVKILDKLDKVILHEELGDLKHKSEVPVHEAIKTLNEEDGRIHPDVFSYVRLPNTSEDLFEICDEDYIIVNLGYLL